MPSGENILHEQREWHEELKFSLAQSQAPSSFLFHVFRRVILLIKVVTMTVWNFFICSLLLLTFSYLYVIGSTQKNKINYKCQKKVEVHSTKNTHE